MICAAFGTGKENCFFTRRIVLSLACWHQGLAHTLFGLKSMMASGSSSQELFSHEQAARQPCQVLGAPV